MDAQPTYITLDGSLIRELVRPELQGSHHLSLAEATIAPGQSTHLHRHRQSEEIYYVLSGAGVVEVAGQRHVVAPGAAVLIPPNSAHRATCTSPEPLRLLCACSPPYRHEDTALDEPATA